MLELMAVNNPFTPPWTYPSWADVAIVISDTFGIGFTITPNRSTTIVRSDFSYLYVAAPGEVVTIYDSNGSGTYYIRIDDNTGDDKAIVLSGANSITDVYLNPKTKLNSIQIHSGALSTVSSYLPPSINSTESMFTDCSSFNQDLSSWDTSNVTSMSTMFENAVTFNQNISNWNTSGITWSIARFNFDRNTPAWQANYKPIFSV